MVFRATATLQPHGFSFEHFTTAWFFILCFFTTCTCTALFFIFSFAITLFFILLIFTTALFFIVKTERQKTVNF